MLDRALKLPLKQSIFLLGPRKTGKSTYLRTYFPQSIYIDLLDTNQLVRYTNEPWLFKEELLQMLATDPSKRDLPIIVDEIQQVPLILNEIHSLIESEKLIFILSGSSARKLRQKGVNLLGGRAGRVYFNPLSLFEIPKEYSLLEILNKGKIPSILLADEHYQLLESYVNVYLKEEILQEGLTRNLRIFSEFLRIASFSQSEQINYSNIAREVGIDNRTIKDYFQILEDTLIGNFIYPFIDHKKRSEIVSSPKFYFFDTGIANFLRGIQFTSEDSSEFGKSFEHLVYLELKTYLDYHAKDSSKISYWRNKKGLEVDFVINDAQVAIEVKSGNLRNDNFEGLLEFKSIYNPTKAFIVANITQSRILANGLTVLTLRDFVESLWKGDIISG